MRKLHSSLDIETHLPISQNPEGKSNQTAYIASTSLDGVDLRVFAWIHLIVVVMLSGIRDLGFEIVFYRGGCAGALWRLLFILNSKEYRYSLRNSSVGSSFAFCIC